MRKFSVTVLVLLFAAEFERYAEDLDGFRSIIYVNCSKAFYQAILVSLIPICRLSKNCDL